MTALREPVHAEQTQPSWRPVCRWVGVAEVTIALQGLRIAPVVLPESGQQRVARVYPGSKYRAATSVITLRPPTEGGRIGAAALRDRALLEHCAEVLNGVVPAPVAVG